MKSNYLEAILAVAILGGATSAFAHGDVSCPVIPTAEKRTQTDLQKKLEAEGWKVRRVQNFNNCYEVYGFDDKGQKAEAFFNAKTYERVYPEGESAEK